jgi:hypothetical protein
MRAMTSMCSASGVPRSFLPSPSSTWKMPRAVGHLDLDAHGLVVAGLDAHLVDGVGGDRVDVQAPGLELHARAALGHVERVGDADDAALDGERAGRWTGAR